MGSSHRSRIIMTKEKIPNGGDWNMANGICRDIDLNTEPWCPDSADQAMEVFCNMAAVHLMPNSVATGVLDESEVQNIAGGFGLAPQPLLLAPFQTPSTTLVWSLAMNPLTMSTLAETVMEITTSTSGTEVIIMVIIQVSLPHSLPVKPHQALMDV